MLYSPVIPVLDTAVVLAIRTSAAPTGVPPTVLVTCPAILHPRIYVGSRMNKPCSMSEMRSRPEGRKGYTPHAPKKPFPLNGEVSKLPTSIRFSGCEQS